MTPVLSIRNLTTYFYTDAGVAKAVEDVSFDVPAGKTVALVGESGCGKSVTALSVLRLIPDPPGKIVSGEVLFDGKKLLALSEREMRALRGNGISMIFQEPMTSLNPVFRIGSQIGAAVRVHRDISKDQARARAVELLAKVGIPAPDQRVDDYPHQMSGGMRQRAMIAMALACDPKLLIADEPTTALDVTIQAQIIDLLLHLQEEVGMAILLITHDLGVVAEMAHEVAIMYAGKIVERAPVHELFAKPQHPYTVALFESLPGVRARHLEDGRAEDGRGRRTLYTIQGQVPPATHFPEGCRFHPRCPFAMDVCPRQAPPFMPVEPGHPACWLYHEATRAAQGRPLGLPRIAEGHP